MVLLLLFVFNIFLHIKIVNVLKDPVFVRVKLLMLVIVESSMNTWDQNTICLTHYGAASASEPTELRCKSGVKSQKVQDECTDGFFSSSLSTKCVSLGRNRKCSVAIPPSVKI